MAEGLKVLITGGGGFVGRELCKSLLSASLRSPGADGQPGSFREVVEVVLFDVPGAFDGLEKDPVCSNAKVRCVTGDINDKDLLKTLVSTPGMSVFHLAGIMSGQGEKEFDLCMRVNFDGTRNLLEACRAKAVPGGPLVRVLFASSGATFGETEESPVGDFTKQVPMNTYGMTKTMGEMLINDYTRKGFVSGCSARLPTVIVRPGKPNAASTSCFSGVIREPCSGVDVELPVCRDYVHGVTSTRALISNLRALHDADFGKVVDRAVTLPSIPITLQILIDALHRVVPKDQHALLGKITDKVDPFLNRVVGTMAAREMYHQRALDLGLSEVPDVDTIVREYIEDFGAACVVKLSSGGEAAEPGLKRRRTQPSSPGKRVAVITGAGAGIGRETALKLAPHFTGLVLVGRTKETLEATAAAAAKVAPLTEIMVRQCNVSVNAEVEFLFDSVAQKFGRCDLLFNNAGVGASPATPDELPVAAWKRCIDTNVTGTFLCTKAAFKLMKEQIPRGGRIVNNGSISAHRPRVKSAAYTASKHAVSGLTKSTNLDGRAFDIACGQIDIGNASTEMTGYIQEGALQPTLDGSERRAPEPTINAGHVADAVAYMAALPLDANVPTMTVMATKMPFVGRG